MSFTAKLDDLSKIENPYIVAEISQILNYFWIKENENTEEIKSLLSDH